MILSKTILILEDDLRVLSKILDKLVILEEDQPFDFSIIVLTNHEQVENMVNNNLDIKPDIILLDRDCKLGGSFHVLDIERFGADKVISISSVPKYNEEARLRGVKRIVEKTLENREDFANKVVAEIEGMVRKMKLI